MSNNLNISQVAESQYDKETTINAATGELDAAITEVLTVTVDSGNAATLTSAQFRGAVDFVIEPDGGDPPSGNITITVPAISRGVFVVVNTTDEQVIVTVSGQSLTPPRVPIQGSAILLCDGSDVVEPGRYVPFWRFFSGMPSAGQLLARFYVAKTVVFPVDMPGSKAQVETVPTSQADFDIRVSGVSKATMTFPASTATATFTAASAFVVNPGNDITILAPNPQDATLTSISFLLAGL